MKICMTNQAKENVGVFITSVVMLATIVVLILLIELVILVELGSESIIVYLNNSSDTYWIKDIGHLLWYIPQFGIGILVYYGIKNSFYIKESCND